MSESVVFWLDIAVIAALVLTVGYTLYKKREIAVSFLVLSDFTLFTFLATLLSEAEMFSGIVFYIWFALYGSFQFLVAALIAAVGLFWTRNRFLAVPSVAFFLYGLFCFSIIIQHIPNGNGEYPLLGILPMYEIYEIVHYSFAMLILLLLADIGSGGRVVRLPFSSCCDLFRNAAYIRAFNLSTGQGYDRIHDDQRE